jgi:hypothetical protein
MREARARGTSAIGLGAEGRAGSPIASGGEDGDEPEEEEEIGMTTTTITTTITTTTTIRDDVPRSSGMELGLVQTVTACRNGVRA